MCTCNNFVPGQKFVRGRDCALCWRQANPIIPKGENALAKRVAVALSLVREYRCEYLLQRTEYKQGCGGMSCQHGCGRGLPAVPGDYCQKCTAYVKDEDNLPWLS